MILVARVLLIALLAAGTSAPRVAGSAAPPPAPSQAPPTAGDAAPASASRLDALPRVPPELAASDESIRRLLAASDAQALVAGALARAEGQLRLPAQRPDGRELPPEAIAVLEDSRRRLLELLRRQLRWERLEAMYVEIYRRTFTQEEVDGVIAFYESPAGRSLRTKLPTVQAWTMEMVQAEMQSLAPALQEIQRDTLRRLQELQLGS